MNNIEYLDDGTYIKYVNPNISNLDLLDKIRVIGNGSFSSGNIEEVKFNDNLELIEENAFRKTKLREIIIKNKIKLSKHSFSYNDFLGKIDIDCETIPSWCFACSGENTDGIEINLKNTVLIDSVAFAKSKIKSIILPDTLKYISFEAFSCTYFKESKLILPEKVEVIDTSAFKNTNLTDIYLPDSVKMIRNLLDMGIYIHMSQKTFKRLELKKDKYIIIEDDSLEKLLKTNSFKEINQKVLNKEIVI